MGKNRSFFGGMLVGFMLGAFLFFLYASAMNLTTDGFYFDGAREMGFSVKTYETKTYYLGANQFVRISSQGFDEGPVEVERFDGEAPSLADLDLVNQACFGNMPSMELSLEHREVKVHGIWYNCRYIISGFYDLEAEQYVNAFGYDGSPITVWSDPNFENELEPLPNGSVLQVVNTETNEFVYQGKKVFTNNDCVSYFVALPPSK